MCSAKEVIAHNAQNNANDVCKIMDKFIKVQMK